MRPDRSVVVRLHTRPRHRGARGTAHSRPARGIGERSSVVGMSWSFERIHAEWLHDGAVTLSPTELVRLFETVEATFGSEWLEGRRGPGGSVGSFPTLRVANAGQLIEAVADLPGGVELLDRLKVDEPGSIAEALVVAALRRSDPAINLVLSPLVRVGQRDRRPDVLAERDAERLYAEVSTPQRSDEYQEVQTRVHALANRALARGDPTWERHRNLPSPGTHGSGSDRAARDDRTDVRRWR